MTVTNPCMEGQGISAHFTYEVTTKTLGVGVGVGVGLGLALP